MTSYCSPLFKCCRFFFFSFPCKMYTPAIGDKFVSFEAAYTSISAFAAANNFSIVLRNTSKNKESGEYVAAAFRCDKSGKYEGKNANYITKRIGCPFKIRIYFLKHTKEYRISTCILTHVHGHGDNNDDHSQNINVKYTSKHQR